MRRLVLVVLVAVACHHDAPPAEPEVPAESRPLPPASGTPVGYLIDDADMHLSTDQLGQLRGIDEILAAQLDQIDKATRAASKPASPDPSQQQPPMGRHGRRGMGGGGGGNTSHRHAGSGAGSASAVVASQAADSRNDAVRSALERVFAILDPAQQARAKQVLSDHDVDLDLGSPQPPHPTADPVEPVEPPPAPAQPPPTIPPPTIPPPSQAGH